MHRYRSIVLTGLLPAAALAAGCGAEPEAPVSPTWADVEPIMRAECTHCHGATAADHGGGYRFDFFDMTDVVCGDAAHAVTSPQLASASAALIGDNVRSVDGTRPKMPPAPAHPLRGWQRETLLRWSVNPVKETPTGNRAPGVEARGLPAVVNQRLEFTIVLSDPDGHGLAGVLTLPDVELLMSRAGAFKVDLDTSAWPPGPRRLIATVCDGWVGVSQDLGPIQVVH